MPKTSEKLSFTGSQGHELAARLDRPVGQPRAYCLFAHCFTCSKDLFAAARVSAELCSRGFAVLRFDFTGLGASDGDFANTNFSSNIADLKAAADYLRQNYAAPTILIGHSLGGAAILAVAGDVPEAKAVVTIGAPADAAHVIENFAAQVNEIEERGQAEVTLAGRKFAIQKQFLDDLRAQTLNDRIARMGKALLVLHAPRDEIVSIDNASEIFLAAKHPKSFVSLDNADHLLSRRKDAAFVADIVAAWSARYLPVQEPDYALPQPGETGVVSVMETGKGLFETEIVSGAHRLLSDEPEDYGGRDAGPSPYDFLSVALGACTSMTLRMYANRKKLSLERVRVDVTHAKVHARDCEDCGEGREGKIDRFERRLEVTGALSDDERSRLMEIADKCPVHKTLSEGAAIVTRWRE
jgi:putative redox protein